MDVRGMDPEVARCVVERLVQRGVDLERLDDGRVEAVAEREIVEVVATCAVAEVSLPE